MGQGPADAPVHFILRVQALLEEGRPREALDTLESSRAMDAGNQYSSAYRSIIALSMGARNPEHPRIVEESLGTMPGSYLAHVIRISQAPGPADPTAGMVGPRYEGIAPWPNPLRPRPFLAAILRGLRALFRWLWICEYTAFQALSLVFTPSQRGRKRILLETKVELLLDAGKGPRCRAAMRAWLRTDPPGLGTRLRFFHLACDFGDIRLARRLYSPRPGPDPEDAILPASAGAGRFPKGTDLQSMACLGRLELLEGRIEEADRIFRMLGREKEYSGMALFHQGIIGLRRGDLQAASRMLGGAPRDYLLPCAIGGIRRLAATRTEVRAGSPA